MISNEKLMDIVAKLLEKAKADEVRWQQEHDDEELTTFSVQFKKSRLYVQFSSPATEPDEIEIGIENSEGKPIKRVAVEEDEDNSTWRLFFDLYQEAERSVLGSDRVLSEIEEELQKEGAVGLL